VNELKEITVAVAVASHSNFCVLCFVRPSLSPRKPNDYNHNKLEPSSIQLVYIHVHFATSVAIRFHTSNSYRLVSLCMYCTFGTQVANIVNAHDESPFSPSTSDLLVTFYICEGRGQYFFPVSTTQNIAKKKTLPQSQALKLAQR